MYYIESKSNVVGNYGQLMCQPFPDCVALPDDLLGPYIEAKGFVYLEVEDGEVVSVEVNQEALDAYLAEHPDQPEPEPEPTTEELFDILLGVT